MFTGIIEATAQILGKETNGIVVARPTSFDDVKIGSSIAVAGVCLSVVQLASAAMRFDVVTETLARTTLGSLRVGDTVNLERSLPADGRFEGHVVQGHIEGVGRVVLQKHSQLIVELPPELLPQVVAKGSVALNGVSLTIASIEQDRITLALIPHTLAHTTLGLLDKGDRINVETDILGRYAKRFMVS